jgi:hypothetical protein
MMARNRSGTDAAIASTASGSSGTISPRLRFGSLMPTQGLEAISRSLTATRKMLATHR